MKAFSLIVASAQAMVLKRQYVPSSDIFIQFVDNVSEHPDESSNLQLKFHAPPAWDDVINEETGEPEQRNNEGDTLIPDEGMDKFWVPNRFFPTEGVFNTHNGKYPGRQMAAYDKTEVEPENSFDLVKKEWQKW